MAISDPWDYILEWWQEYQADPRADATKIESGLKKQQTKAEQLPQEIDPAVVGSLQTAACQYWVKGLPSVCTNWKNVTVSGVTLSHCGFSTTNSGIPTGYALGGCDGLGRRIWCDKYEGEEYDPNKYACVLPCIERSGAGRIIREAGGVKIIPWKPSEIVGYNPDDRNVGRCDNNGMGRGVAGFKQKFIENLQQLPPICKQYKPHQLGFGAVDPRPYHGSPPSSVWKTGQTYIPRTPAQLHDGSQADPLVMMQKRLPFTFTIYNLRARFQKCAHWDSDYGGKFEFDDYGADPSYFQIYTKHEATELCKLYGTNPKVKPFCDIDETNVGIPWVLQQVWTTNHNIVCNGAKPECPCYTGRWFFCIDRNMQDGMRISADQIFELRFWASDWSSQEEYDKYYEAKPGITQEGFGDITTADIYTFTKWLKLDVSNPNESIMSGNKHHLCMPTPLQSREFVPAQYVNRTPITYPKAGDFIGTTSYTEAVYPTLVRELENPDDLFPDILVMYPYATINPWDVYPCDEEDRVDYCIHNNNLMHADPKITIIGQCIRNRRVWAFNTTYTGGRTSGGGSSSVINIMKTYVRTQLIPAEKYSVFCSDIKNLINNFEIEGADDIVSGETDENGFFNLSNLVLKNGEINDIFIICEYDSGDYPNYVYRHRKVKSCYFGALITQSSFTHSHEGDIWYDTTPSFFTPSAKINGAVQATNGKVSNVIPCYSHYRYSIMMDINYYSYCFNRYEKEIEDVEEWTQIGQTGYIWAEIPDKDINYLWDWEVLEASLTPKPVEDSDPPIYRASLCGENTENYDELIINLEVVTINKKQLPPNAVLFVNKRNGEPFPKGFFNSDWSLKIKYRYIKMENFVGEDPYWPPNIGEDFGLNQFRTPPYQILFEPESSQFSIEEIGGVTSLATPAVMAFVVDLEEERIQAVAATKMLMMGHRLTCRSVEIYYAYKGDATAYDLEPSSGFFTWRGSPTVNPVTSVGMVHHREAKCGDHECNSSNCIGPMWYPFNNCASIDFYNVLNGAAQCTMPISEGDNYVKLMGDGAARYCMAEEFKAWVTAGGNWASSCGTSFYYHYSSANPNSMTFVGSAKIRGKVDSSLYNFMEWVLPPFGNTGRGSVERWLFRDYVSFYDSSGPTLTSRAEYMPLVLDREDLLTDMDAFDTPGISSHPNLQEPFSHRSILSNLLANWISESSDEQRFRFDDVIEPEYHGNCMYPWPALTGIGGSYRVIRYKLKNSNGAWVWPEYWRKIERAILDEKLLFIDIQRQNYYYDLNKSQHRYITNEGLHTIEFVPPEIISSEPKEESSADVLAKISLDGENWRFFKLIYDNYGNDQVDWVDESVFGEEGGSGGTDEEGEEAGNIYEEANNGRGQNGGQSANPNWLHDFDTLFDAEASSTPNNNRKALIGQDVIGTNIYGYYNRGVVVKMYKNRLNLLPMEEQLFPPGESYDESFLLDTTISGLVTLSWESADYPTATRAVIKGIWGISNEEKSEDEGEDNQNEQVLLCIPTITFKEMRSNTMSNVLVNSPRSAYTLTTTVGKTDAFSIELNFSKYPNRILYPSTRYDMILKPMTMESIHITSIELYGSSYKPTKETINVWEQKFIQSTISDAILDRATNADGPNSKLYRDYDRDLKNGGQYLPSENTNLWPEGGAAISKMAMVSATKLWTTGEDEDIEVTRSTLKTVEKDEQERLYKEAYALDNFDTVSLSPFCPPDIKYFTSSIVPSAISISPPACTLTHSKVDWIHNKYQRQFIQKGDFFSPGGHYFRWSEDFFQTRCYIFGPVETVYTVEWVHHRHSTGDEGVPTADALTSYVGWTRLAYYEGRLWSMTELDQSDTGQPTDVLSGAKNQVYDRS